MSEKPTSAPQSTPLDLPQTRFIRGCLQNLIWLVPLIAITWPLVLHPPVTLVCYCVITIVGSGLVAGLSDPVSIRSREGTDRGPELAVGLGLLAGLIWTAFDLRWPGPSNTVPPLVQWAALVVLLAAYALRIWAVTTNQFFSSLLTIQEERGHAVIQTGPYGLVRHPGNLSIVLIVICAPLAVNCYYAYLPMAVSFVAILKRTSNEDRFLHEKLSGYSEYASRVRYRLLPGIY
jgi:protein-S-isoprenylcysteine O-methyltransferase Ste14